MPRMVKRAVLGTVAVLSLCVIAASLNVAQAGGSSCKSCDTKCKLKKVNCKGKFDVSKGKCTAWGSYKVTFDPCKEELCIKLSGELCCDSNHCGDRSVESDLTYMAMEAMHSDCRKCDICVRPTGHKACLQKLKLKKTKSCCLKFTLEICVEAESCKKPR